jgi:hypothetical protein
MLAVARVARVELANRVGQVGGDLVEARSHVVDGAPAFASHVCHEAPGLSVESAKELH